MKESWLTCCIVLVVVYNVWYGVEGMLFSQIELSGVTDFNLVMSNISIGAVYNQRE